MVGAPGSALFKDKNYLLPILALILFVGLMSFYETKRKINLNI